MVGGLLLASPSAHAGTLTSATWFQVTEARPGFLPGVPMTRSSAQLGALGNSTGASIAVNLSYPLFGTTVFVPKTPNQLLDFTIKVTQGGPQAITATPGMASGAPGIPGTVIVSAPIHRSMGVNQSMFNQLTIVRVPLSHGKAGQFTATFSVLGVYHQLTADFFAWTPGTVTFTGLTSIYAALPDVTAMGSFNLTPNGGGMVTLVSPSKVTIDGSLVQVRSASFSTLVLSFVPEPSTLLLLGGSALALTLAGGRARR
jgi:hypothetical protein